MASGKGWTWRDLVLKMSLLYLTNKFGPTIYTSDELTSREPVFNIGTKYFYYFWWRLQIESRIIPDLESEYNSLYWLLTV